MTTNSSYAMSPGMLHKVQIFELYFNYLYSNSNAGNLVFVCTSQNGLIEEYA